MFSVFIKSSFQFFVVGEYVAVEFWKSRQYAFQKIVAVNSIIGVILGVPLGLSFTYFMLNFAGDEFDMMISVSPRTLIISSAITLGVSILVSFLFRRKINKLNMVEALKGVE